MGYRDESMREFWRREIDDFRNALSGVWQAVQDDARVSKSWGVLTQAWDLEKSERFVYDE